MQITAEARNKMQEITTQFPCQSKYKCYNSSLTDLSRVKKYGAEDLVQCLEKDLPKKCGHSFSFGYKYFCKCPLRLYIVNEFNM